MGKGRTKRIRYKERAMRARRRAASLMVLAGAMKVPAPGDRGAHGKAASEPPALPSQPT